MTVALKYPGAKNRIAQKLLAYMPAHKVYLEPYAGSLSFLLQKPRSYIETVNDLDGRITNFFSVLRDCPLDLISRLSLTPYSRVEYERAYQDHNVDDPVERARIFAIQCWMGFGSGCVYKNGFRSGQSPTSPNPAKAWKELPDVLAAAADRLMGVQIECLPALELIRRYNKPGVFIYADPPYLQGTRKQHLYKYEMSDQDHIDLLNVLIKHNARIMLSGYDNPLYNRMLSGWNKAYIETYSECSHKRTEVIWCNFPLGQMTLDDFK